MTTIANVHALPPHLLLGLLSGHGPDEAAANLAALAVSHPDLADRAAAQVAATGLAVIRDGHQAPDRLARHVLQVCSAASPVWDHIGLVRGADGRWVPAVAG